MSDPHRKQAQVTVKVTEHLSNVLARLGLPHLTVSTALRAFVTAGAYFVADAVLNKIALGDGWQIFWPLNGVTIALLISRPRREWALLLVAVALGTGVGEFIDDNSFLSTLVQRSLSLMEVTLSAAFLPPFLDLESWLGMPRLYRPEAMPVSQQDH